MWRMMTQTREEKNSMHWRHLPAAQDLNWHHRLAVCSLDMYHPFSSESILVVQRNGSIVALDPVQFGQEGQWTVSMWFRPNPSGLVGDQFEYLFSQQNQDERYTSGFEPNQVSSTVSKCRNMTSSPSAKDCFIKDLQMIRCHIPVIRVVSVRFELLSCSLPPESLLTPSLGPSLLQYCKSLAQRLWIHKPFPI